MQRCTFHISLGFKIQGEHTFDFKIEDDVFLCMYASNKQLLYLVVQLHTILTKCAALHFREAWYMYAYDSGGSGISAFLPKCILATYASIYNFVRHAGQIFHVSLLFKCPNKKGADIIKREKFKDSTKEHERRLYDKGMDVFEKTT